MPKKRVIVSFDGTWNLPDAKPEIDGDTNTNVEKLHSAILKTCNDGVEQVACYLTGVGTNWYDKFRGGIFGVGLDEKIKEGYKFLIEKYASGDDLFIFGFSRGAYSARSLVGLIRNSGLLKEANEDRIDEAYHLYRMRDESADTENAKFFRNEYAQTDVSIHCIGVWDTVGALGIPVESFKWFNKALYQFHDTELSGIVKNAFHALAIDENRKNYRCTLWDPKKKPNQKMEQVWFSGAHSNIGGGYAYSNLSDIALNWMVKKATDCGLALDYSKIPAVPENPGPITDSYKEFLDGVYSALEPRFFREIGSTEFGMESIDNTVKKRLKSDPNYKPKNKVDEYLEGAFTPVGRLEA